MTHIVPNTIIKPIYVKVVILVLRYACCLVGYYRCIVFSQIFSSKYTSLGHFVRLGVAPTFWLWLLRLALENEEPLWSHWFFIFKG